MDKRERMLKKLWDEVIPLAIVLAIFVIVFVIYRSF